MPIHGHDVRGGIDRNLRTGYQDIDLRPHGVKDHERSAVEYAVETVDLDSLHTVIVQVDLERVSLEHEVGSEHAQGGNVCSAARPDEIGLGRCCDGGVVAPLTALRSLVDAGRAARRECLIKENR